MPGFVHDGPRRPVMVRQEEGEDIDVTAAFDSLCNLLVRRTYGYAWNEHGAVYARVGIGEEVDCLIDWCREHNCSAQQLITHKAVYLVNLTAYKE